MFEQVAEAGVDCDDVTDTLEREGVQKFIDSFTELLEGIDAKRKLHGVRDGAGRAHWEEAGEGPPVVWSTRRSATAACGTRSGDLSPVHRTVRFDQRGFGRSALEPGTISHARDLIDLMDELALERAALVGGSLGGRVVLEVAIAQPDRVEKLVLLNPGLPGHDWSQEVQAG